MFNVLRNNKIFTCEEKLLLDEAKVSKAHRRLLLNNSYDWFRYLLITFGFYTIITDSNHWVAVSSLIYLLIEAFIFKYEKSILKKYGLGKLKGIIIRASKEEQEN